MPFYIFLGIKKGTPEVEDIHHDKNPIITFTPLLRSFPICIGNLSHYRFKLF